MYKNILERERERIVLFQIIENRIITKSKSTRSYTSRQKKKEDHWLKSHIKSKGQKVNKKRINTLINKRIVKFQHSSRKKGIASSHCVSSRLHKTIGTRRATRAEAMQGVRGVV